MINLYTTPSGNKFLCYGKDIELPEGFSLVEKEINPAWKEYRFLPIIPYYDFVIKSLFDKRTDSARLDSEGIRCWDDYFNAHVLYMTKELRKPKSIRELMQTRYQEILDEFPDIKEQNEQNS